MRVESFMLVFFMVVDSEITHDRCIISEICCKMLNISHNFASLGFLVRVQMWLFCSALIV